MLQDKLPKERIALVGLVALLVAAGSYAIVKGQRQPAPIVFQGVAAPSESKTTPPIEPAKDSKQAESGVLVVHATGAVKQPQVLRLPAQSRVDDAVRAAGGATPDADLEAINLAAKLIDGSQVYVPKKGVPGTGDNVAEAYKGGAVATSYNPHPRATASGGSAGRTKKEPPSQPVNLNSANAEELQRVPGIGPSTAQKILDYRKGHGKFNSVDELLAVKGFGQKKLDAMAKFLRV